MKGNMRKSMVWVGIVLGCVSWARAQQEGGQAGGFLRYGVGGRALGMGKAFVAVADDASGVFWNPAGIINGRRTEMTSMYSNLYYDSQFAHFGCIVPRLLSNPKSRFIDLLFGPSSAWGFGWIGLSMADFEQRDDAALLLGNFGLQENAFLLSWAREEVSFWGIIQYGITAKVVNQNFNGLLETAALDSRTIDRSWSPGADVGLTFQPIHAPLFRIISLRYLLPLRFGMTVHNLVQPGWNSKSGTKEPFPRVFRFGIHYRWILEDWIPASWTFLHRCFKSIQIVTAYDLEKYSDVSNGHYFGAEGVIPLSNRNVFILPRFGINNRTESPCFGMGLSIPFTPSALVRIDYAYAIHSELPNDNRLFLTFQIGKEKAEDFFWQRSNDPSSEAHRKKKDDLKILSLYPNHHLLDSARDLKLWEQKSSIIARYLQLIGGIELARWEYDGAKVVLDKNFEKPKDESRAVREARRKARKAVKEYTAIFDLDQGYSLSDPDLLDYSEAMIISMEKDSTLRNAVLSKVVDQVLYEVDSSAIRKNPKQAIRYWYTLGLANKLQRNWEGVKKTFKDLADTESAIVDPQADITEEDVAVLLLSKMILAEAHIQSGNLLTARYIISTVLQNTKDYKTLPPYYPRYPAFSDSTFLDDAQFLLGICTVLDSSDVVRSEEPVSDEGMTDRMRHVNDEERRFREGVNAIMLTEKYYGNYEYGRLVRENSPNLIDAMLRKDWERLKETVMAFLHEYIKRHSWPMS